MAGVQNISLTAPTDYTADQQSIERQRKMAELLQQQSMQPLDTNQTAGGYVLPVSPIAGLAKMLQAYGASKGMEQADAKQKALAQQIRDAGASDVTSLMGALQGTPAQLPATPNDDEGNMNPLVKETAPDKQRALAIALNSQSPMVQGVGQSLLANMLKSPEWKLGERFNQATGKPEKFMYDQNDPTKQMAIGGQQGVSADTEFKESGLDRRFAGVSGNTAATLGQADRHWGSISPYQQAQLGNDRAGLGIRAAGLNLDRQRFAFETNPEAQAGVSQAKAAGTTTGNATAQAALDLPQAVATAKQGVDLINQMIGDAKVNERGQVVIPKGGKQPHSGFEVSVGASAQPGFQHIPGTDKASFYALKDQVLGGAFMEAYKSLRGGGQITEVEGTKATAAITRMNTAQSEPEFIKAAREFQDVIKAGVQRAQQKASPMRRSTDGASGGWKDL